jgi:hypothetical protein
MQSTVHTTVGKTSTSTSSSSSSSSSTSTSSSSVCPLLSYSGLRIPVERADEGNDGKQKPY